MSQAREARITSEIRCSALLRRADELLLVRHTRGDRAYWVLPGGRPQAGEVASATVEREVHEESGLRVSVGRIVFVWEGIARDRGLRLVELVFAAELAGRGRAPRSQGALELPRFVAFEELGSIKLYPPVAGYLRAIQRYGLGQGAQYLGNLYRRDEPMPSPPERFA